MRSITRDLDRGFAGLETQAQVNAWCSEAKRGPGGPRHVGELALACVGQEAYTTGYAREIWGYEAGQEACVTGRR
jgi:hypothetical protein